MVRVHSGVGGWEGARTGRGWGSVCAGERRARKGPHKLAAEGAYAWAWTPTGSALEHTVAPATPPATRRRGTRCGRRAAFLLMTERWSRLQARTHSAHSLYRQVTAAFQPPPLVHEQVWSSSCTICSCDRFIVAASGAVLSPTEAATDQPVATRHSAPIQRKVSPRTLLCHAQSRGLLARPRLQPPVRAQPASPHQPACAGVCGDSWDIQAAAA